MDMNWIDLVIGTLIVLAVLIGWRRGFLAQFPAVAALLASLWLAMRLYLFASQWISGVTEWPVAWTKPLGFLLILSASLLSQRWLYACLISGYRCKCIAIGSIGFWGSRQGWSTAWFKLLSLPRC